MRSFVVMLLSSLHFTTAIYKGTNAGEGEYPFSVSILQKGLVKCGGSLVTFRYVFTACQCIGSFELKATEPQSSTENAPTVTTTTTSTVAPKMTTAAPTVTYVTTDTLADNSTTDVANSTVTQIITNATKVTTTTTEIAATGSGANLDTRATIKSFKSIPLDQVLLVAATNWIYEFGEGQVRRPDQSHPHPDCNGTITPWLNDFGLYRVSHNFLFTFAISLMNVRNNDREELSNELDALITDGRVCETVGWGAMEILPNGTTFQSEKLRKASVRLISPPVCAQMLCQPPHFFCNDSIFSENRFICGINTGRGESCQGDEGNPLICDGYVYGLLAWSPSCAAHSPKLFSALHFGLDFYNAASSGMQILSTGCLLALPALLPCKLDI